mmetsp:Transcript_12720/g.10876  ORF Transcript_12720/g.10876 Transcript_12720/m.10876 type:complete len:138 (+) Transcript_12720:155-568(+)
MWMGLATFVIPLVFITNKLFWSILICQAGNTIGSFWTLHKYGLVKLMSLFHLIFWTPMLVKFGIFYEHLDATTEYVFGWIMISTVSISLVLDVKDYIEWCKGERDPIPDIIKRRKIEKESKKEEEIEPEVKKVEVKE